MEDKFKRLLETIDRSDYIQKTPEDVYNEIANKTELSPKEVAMIGGVESQHGKYEDNMAGGSAKGIMQIMPKLAEALKPGSSANLKDRNIQSEIASDFLNLNTPTIKELAARNNRKEDISDYYSMYNLGKGKGKEYILAKDDQNIEEVLPAKVIKNNPKLYRYKTVGKSKEALRNFLKERGEEFNFTIPETKLMELFSSMNEGKKDNE